MRNSIRRSMLLVSLPLAVLIIGTAGFAILEELSFIDALYFTVVTISTVGYGDIYPTNMASKLFGIVMIIIGIGAFLTLVTNVTQVLVQKGRDRLRRQRLNMIIGVFFTEVGNQLLRLFVRYDDNIGEIRGDFVVKENWGDTDFRHLNNKLRHHEFTIDPGLMELEKLCSFLKEKGDLLLRQIENPDLIEHESFTELLWATVHLRDELMSRKSFLKLPESDLAHLAGDAQRAYVLLAKQWTSYLQHLKRRYPYLFSLALRTNPYIESISAIVE
ncbi:MAG: potassium channel family protein [Dehalococcoidales bacterium]|nr:potassium channel family protein [Dehalococcoidales bacterium]